MMMVSVRWRCELELSLELVPRMMMPRKGRTGRVHPIGRDLVVDPDFTAFLIRRDDIRRAEEFRDLGRRHADFDLSLDLPDGQPVLFDFGLLATTACNDYRQTQS